MSDQESAEEPEDGSEDAASEEHEGLSEGDFVTLAYTARTVEDGSLVDTTDREVAEEEGVAEEGQEFEPRTIVIGAGHLFDPVEDAIVGGAVGDEDTVTVPAAEAFGEYDDEEVRTVSADKIDEDDRYPGAHVQVDGQEGHLETIIGGRARVDFNHPLAGEDIEYEYEVLDVLEGREEKARALLSTYLDMELEVRIETDSVEELQPVESDDDDDDEESEPEFEEVTVEKESLYVESTPQLSFNQQWMFQKQQIAQEMMDRVDVDRVVIEEVIDGSGGMMGGMGGMMGGMGGMGGGGGEDPLADADVDADELVEELEGGEE